MAWLQALSALLKLANLLAGYLRDKQLLEAGEARAISESLSVAQSRVQVAMAARAAVKHDPDSVRNDPYNRD